MYILIHVMVKLFILQDVPLNMDVIVPKVPGRVSWNLFYEIQWCSVYCSLQEYPQVCENFKSTCIQIYIPVRIHCFIIAFSKVIAKEPVHMRI